MTSAAGMGKYGSNGGREEREREKKGGLSRSQKIKKQEERERGSENLHSVLEGNLGVNCS